MPLVKIPLLPGVFKDDTPLSAEGRWVDADKVRFVMGMPQTIGGYESVTTDTIAGICRGIHTWADAGGVRQIGLGTHSHLYAYQGGTLADITPNGSAGTLGADPFAVTAGSATVTVTHTVHGRARGDRVFFAGAAEGGGITVAGEYAVASVVDADSYTITHSSAATSTDGTTGGASVAYQYRIPNGLVDGLGGAGYGTGGYGGGTYGAASTGDVFPRTWSLDNWGEHLVACHRGGPIFEWRLSTAARAERIAEAPARCAAIFVTPERQLVAVGCTNLDGVFDPMCVRASDIEDNTAWTPSAATAAVQRVLAGGSRLVRGLAARGINLIWSDTHLFAMRYVGDPPLVFSFATLGDNCGLIGPNAATLAAGGAFWLAPNGQFFTWQGGAPQAIPCTLRRDVVDNIAAAQGDKVFAASITAFGEVWWFYPDARDGAEVSRYVAHNYLEGHWTCGTFDRTAFTDARAFEHPIGVSSKGTLYFHERGFSADGGAFSWRLDGAPMDIGDGDRLAHVGALVPDTEDQQGAFAITLSGRLYPPGAARTAGPFTVHPGTTKIDTRVTARQIALGLSGSVAPCFMRLGALRADVRETGQRR